MLYGVLGAASRLVAVRGRVVAVCRLAFWRVDALVLPTRCSGWYYSEQALAEGIVYAMLAGALRSWVYSLVRKIAALVEQRRYEKANEEILIQRGLEDGRNGGGTVRVDDLQD